MGVYQFFYGGICNAAEKKYSIVSLELQRTYALSLDIRLLDFQLNFRLLNPQSVGSLSPIGDR
jgi:hypothetical protein